MGTMLGADPDQLKELAVEARRGGKTLEQTSSMISGALQKARWYGGNADRFRTTWNSQHRSALSQVAAILEEVSKVLQLNAQQQIDVSAADFGGGDSGELPRDLPGDPMQVPEMGVYQPLPDNIPFDAKALDPSNISQGGVGDCWFLAAAGAVAKDDPDWIRERVQKQDDGTWIVKMYKDGWPVLITVEPTVPEISAADADGNPNWLSIYEKAAAEFYEGDYENLDGGYSDEGLRVITGMETKQTSDVDFDAIEKRLNEGPVVLGTESTKTRDWANMKGIQIDDDRIVPNHAYIVDRFENRVNPDTGAEERMIHLLNPWGPNGGNLEGDTPPPGQNQRWGDIWLTEQQYKDNFSGVYSGKSTKD